MKFKQWTLGLPIREFGRDIHAFVVGSDGCSDIEVNPYGLVRATFGNRRIVVFGTQHGEEILEVEKVEKVESKPAAGRK
jgi:hypothetical protein